MDLEIKDTELVWPEKFDELGKLREITHVNLPLQIIETFNESTSARQEKKNSGMQQTLFEIWQGDQGQTFETGWKSKLIWGENKYVMSSLLEKYAGKIDLIYIDPPFATGADFSFQTDIGNKEISKSPSAIEMKVYNDTWGKGVSSYLQMIYDRLALMKDLLSSSGSIYVHIDSRISHYIKVILDGIFGRENFVSEIIWKRRVGIVEQKKRFGSCTDTILLYSKSDNYTFFRQFTKVDTEEYVEERFKFTDKDGRKYSSSNLVNPGYRPTLVYEYKGYKPPPNGWAISKEKMEQWDKEGKLIFPKDKSGRIRRKQYLDEWQGRPIQNLWDDLYQINSMAKERLNYPTQKPESLLERIIRTSTKEGDLIADFFCGSGTALAVAEKLGRRWIGCDISRFAVHTTRKRLLEIEKCKAFEILNLGKYERQIWQRTSFSQKNETTVLYQYLAFILKLYKAEPITGFQFIHGRKGKALVHVGAVDSPVTIDEISSALAECVATKQTELHILGWEWEMGLHDLIEVEARKQNVKLRLLVIPNEIIQADVPQRDDVKFYDLAYMQAKVKVNNKTAQVELQEFVIPNTELIPEDLKIKHWSDLIDYWAVDFDFRNDTFMNHWSTYRTAEKPKLDLKSAEYEYKKNGKFGVVVKVVDVFGIDSSRYYEIDV